MADSIAQQVRAAGIVGAGGAGFPTHVKFDSQVEIAIANGAECEPLLRCDKAVMRERGAEVLDGLSLLGQATGARRLIIALKAHYAPVVAAVREAIRSSFPRVELFLLDNYYPAGDEQVLVNAVTGRVVPEGGIPLNVGVVVDNVVTLRQVARAVRHGEAVTSRPLTVAGAVRQPLTCELPIGAPLQLAIDRAGGPTVSHWVAIDGGPMMGRLAAAANEPITKKTSGIIVLPNNHPLVQSKTSSIEREVKLGRTVCCQCRMCTDLCPRHLLGHDISPHLAMRTLLAAGLTEAPSSHITAAYLCCLCGVCDTYACTLGLSPRRVFEHMRAQLTAAGVRNPHQRKELTPHEFQALRRVPTERLIQRLGLGDYARAPEVVDWGAVEAPRVRLLLSQHTGASAQPVVAVGQRVERGELVAEIPEGKLGARLHASISGTVTAIDGHAVEIARS
ncbi:MAG: SLBB domain-containing protein [Deltaproteobacteria bacterium]|nr:SLBB domain-containing protein [Deltaproteobacteria bacterium]